MANKYEVGQTINVIGMEGNFVINSVEEFEDSYIYEIMTPEGETLKADETQIFVTSFKYIIELPDNEQVERVISAELNYGDVITDPETQQQARVLVRLPI